MDLSTITWNFSTKVEFFRPFSFYIDDGMACSSKEERFSPADARKAGLIATKLVACSVAQKPPDRN